MAFGPSAELNSRQWLFRYCILDRSCDFATSVFLWSAPELPAFDGFALISTFLLMSFPSSVEREINTQAATLSSPLKNRV